MDESISCERTDGQSQEEVIDGDIILAPLQNWNDQDTHQSNQSNQNETENGTNPGI